jgi:hypothetical protein
MITSLAQKWAEESLLLFDKLFKFYEQNISSRLVKFLVKFILNPINFRDCCFTDLVLDQVLALSENLQFLFHSALVVNVDLLLNFVVIHKILRLQKFLFFSHLRIYEARQSVSRLIYLCEHSTEPDLIWILSCLEFVCQLFGSLLV